MYTSHLQRDALAGIEPNLAYLLRVARRILGCDEQAHDAVQEALISLWREERLPPNPPAWLVQAVINRSLHARRCRERRRKHEARAGTKRLLHAEPEHEHAVECDELRARIRAAVAALAEEYRVVFELREVHGLDYEAIAERVAIPVGTVRSRIHRARHQLQQILERDRAS